jgi:hypothetical protein
MAAKIDPKAKYVVVLTRAVTRGPHIHRARVPIRMTGAFLIALREEEGDAIIATANKV